MDARSTPIETENPCVDSSILSLGTQSQNFWKQVDRSGGPDTCWPWTGRTDRDGYGVFGKKGSAHRTACELAHGAPFPRAEAAHSCDNPPCCNGAHLSWKTHAQNVAEQFERGNHYNVRRRFVDYRAARIALGLTPAEADAAGERARRLGRRIARGEISFRRAREIIGLGAAFRSIERGAR